MGGTVSLLVGIQYPQRVSKVVVVGSPIVGSSLALALKLAGRRPIATLLFNIMWAFRMGLRVASPYMCRDPRFPAMMDKDLSRTTLESFLLSIASLRRTDLQPMLPQVKVPVMGMYGDKDIIVHPMQWKIMLDGIPHACVERFPTAGHFIMLDSPDIFIEKLKNFLDDDRKTT
jgi:pimeloyl-ACP methyl ester carboxylesterase